MHQGIYNNTCAAAAQRFLGATERLNNSFIAKCPSKWKPKAYSIGYLNSNSIEIVDGDFGPNTADYVRCWQHHFSLSADGVIGPNTWASMTGTCGATRAIRESYAYYGVSCKN
jgi:peptidoglycan hydrolase-like protein with peptidoglycan-binding domain